MLMVFSLVCAVGGGVEDAREIGGAGTDETCRAVVDDVDVFALVSSVPASKESVSVPTDLPEAPPKHILKYRLTTDLSLF